MKHNTAVGPDVRETVDPRHWSRGLVPIISRSRLCRCDTVIRVKSGLPSIARPKRPTHLPALGNFAMGAAMVWTQFQPVYFPRRGWRCYHLGGAPVGSHRQL
jgi:hypothetical protein